MTAASRETVYSLREYGNLLLAAYQGEVPVQGVPVGRSAVAYWSVREHVAWAVVQIGWQKALSAFQKLGREPGKESALAYAEYLGRVVQNTFGVPP